MSQATLEHPKQILSSSEARELVQELLITSKSKLNSELVKKLVGAIMTEENRKNILLADIHIVLSEFYNTHKRKEGMESVLTMVLLLSEEIKYNYTLGVNGKFLTFMLKFYDDCVNQSLPDNLLNDLHDVRIFLLLGADFQA